MTFTQQFPNAKINVLRYFTVHDPHNSTPNWSRRYEWEYAYQACANVTESHTILNAACGTNHLHASFARRLAELGTVYNCDMSPPIVEELFDNFFIHDILQPLPQKYDDVVCVSTVEDFLDPVIIEKAIINLAKCAKRKLIITADIYEQVKAEWFTHMVGQPNRRLDDNHALTGANSSYPQHEFSHLKILLIDISL